MSWVGVFLLLWFVFANVLRLEYGLLEDPKSAGECCLEAAVMATIVTTAAWLLLLEQW